MFNAVKQKLRNFRLLLVRWIRIVASASHEEANF
jgi:hypothetical protein